MITRRLLDRFACVLVALAALGSAAAAGPREEIVRNVDKTLPLAAGQRLTIEHKNGNIRVRAEKTSEARIVAKIRGSSSNEAEIRKFIEAVSINIDASPSGISVRTVYPDTNWRSLFGGLSVSFSVDYEIVMPEGALLEVRNRFGDVAVSGLKAAADINNGNGRVDVRDGRGRLQIENSFGPVDVSGIAGEVTITSANGEVAASNSEGPVDIHNRFGRVTATAIKKGVRIFNGNGGVRVEDVGGPSTVESSFGAVELRNLRGAASVENTNGSVSASGIAGSLSVRGSFGKVEANDVGGTAEVRTANASVHLRDVRGAATVKTSFGLVECEKIDGELSVENANGAVSANDVRGGVVVRTSFGPVALDGIGGRIRVDNQNGSIDVRGVASRKGKDCAGVELKTSFSSIRVAVPEDTGWAVEARTSFGHIRSDLPITVSGSLSVESMQGKIGDGACPLTLIDSNGAIEIQKSDGGRSRR